MELSKRLEAVTSMVPNCHVVCDIGCDHGYVAIELINRKVCDHVIAADVNEGPLQAATENVEMSGLGDYIETRISDGLLGIQLSDCADCVVIAGMGARLMTKILASRDLHIRKDTRLILQPQSEWHLVRHYIRVSGYQIVRENMVLDAGKYYVIMDVALPKQPCTTNHWGKSELALRAKQCQISPERLETICDSYSEYLIVNRHPILLDYLQNGCRKNRELLEQIAKEKRQDLSEKTVLMEDTIRLIETK